MATASCTTAVITPRQTCRPVLSRARSSRQNAAARNFLPGAPLGRRASNGAKCTAFLSGLKKRLRPDSEDAGVYGSQKREDYSADDVEHYFNYMGLLATEGSYDRMNDLLQTGQHPADVLLLMASSENDTPKVAELLRAGADVNVKDPDGKTPVELATSPEVLEMLQGKAPVA